MFDFSLFFMLLKGVRLCVCVCIQSYGVSKTGGPQPRVAGWWWWSRGGPQLNSWTPHGVWSQFTPSRRSNKQQTLTPKFGLQSFQMRCIHTDQAWMEARSGYITAWTAGTINQLHMLPVLQPSQGLLRAPVPVCLWGVAVCAVCFFFFFFIISETLSAWSKGCSQMKVGQEQRFHKPCLFMAKSWSKKPAGW